MAPIAAFLVLLAFTIPSHARNTVGRALLKKDYAYVCIRPLAFMPGDALDPNFAVHCYLQSGSGTAPTWTIAYDDYGTHNEVDPRHPDRHCVRVKSASLQAIKDSAYVQVRDGPWLVDDYELLDNNCCHFIDQVLVGAGSPGVESYFPDFSLPEWEPRD